MTHPSGFSIGAPRALPTGPRLNEDITQVERMETDLRDKVQAQIAAHNLSSLVHGVFSIDDLEGKLASDLCNHIGVGVGFVKIEPTAMTDDPKKANSAINGQAGTTLDFVFAVIMAVPTNEQCEERHAATKVLTALRLGIMGSIIAGDPTTRTWGFVREAPDIANSSNDVLYYVQVWRVAMPIVGNR